MFRDKLRQLLSGLRDATARGAVKWEETADESMFRTHLASGMVRIGRYPTYPEGQESFPDECAYCVCLLKPDGTVAAEMDVKEGPELAVAADLYDMARRSSRGAEELLDRMLADLDTRKVGSR